MKRQFSLVLAIVLCVGTSGIAQAEDNVPPPGFKALFNGKDLTGWQIIVEPPQKKGKTAEQIAALQKTANEKLKSWSIRDGVLHYDGKGNSLQTIKDYGDFELWCDWKIGPKGDSGIYVRGSPQIQIWDPADRPEGSGGLFNNAKNPNKPSKCADKPIGEWNTFRVVMKGEKVSVWLNGELVVDNVTMENYWDRKEDPNKPIPATGPIELQHHGNPLEFKNIYVKELAPGSAARGTDAKSDGVAKLFNGRDMTGWTHVLSKDDVKLEDVWSVSDGMIICKGTPSGYIRTKDEFENYTLTLEWRWKPGSIGGNSGVLVHSTTPKAIGVWPKSIEVQLAAGNAGDFWVIGTDLDVENEAARKKDRRHLNLTDDSEKPPGEWNKMEVVCKGNEITVKVNGDLVNHATNCTVTKGAISLQSEGAEVHFRNIELRPIK
jgi:hypothetical protein